MPYKYGMTKRDFTRRILKGKKDVLQAFLDRLRDKKIRFCVIGGLAVNAYAAPVVSPDLDVIVASDRIQDLREALSSGFRAKEFPNSLNISCRGSDLRIQIRTDPRYQAFLGKARMKNVLGYDMPVARIEDVLQGKIWAALDETRRPSKRQKDLADILRLVEKRKNLARFIPAELKSRLSL
jgi:hypothetical protein